MSLISRVATFDLGVTLPTRSSGVCAYELVAVTSAPHCNINRWRHCMVSAIKELFLTVTYHRTKDKILTGVGQQVESEFQAFRLTAAILVRARRLSAACEVSFCMKTIFESEWRQPRIFKLLQMPRLRVWSSDVGSVIIVRSQFHPVKTI